MKHPHHDLICEWAKDTGRVVQCRSLRTGEWLDVVNPPLWLTENEYRFKPEPKPDVVQKCKILRMGGSILWNTETGTVDGANIRLHYDGETGKLKSAEVL